MSDKRQIIKRVREIVGVGGVGGALDEEERGPVKSSVTTFIWR